jgi:predicted RND superfamily exporter protein
LTGLGNAVRIAVDNPKGSIYDAAYLETLRQLSDEVFLLPGVARNQMKSLWTPATRWVGVTEDGLEGGPVIPDGYDGAPPASRNCKPTSPAPARSASWLPSTATPA